MPKDSLKLDDLSIKELEAILARKKLEARGARLRRFRKSAQDLETLLHYNGFKVISKYAEHDGTPATAEKPPGVFICKKR